MRNGKDTKSTRPDSSSRRAPCTPSADKNKRHFHHGKHGIHGKRDKKISEDINKKEPKHVFNNSTFLPSFFFYPLLSFFRVFRGENVFSSWCYQRSSSGSGVGGAKRPCLWR